MSRRRLPLLLAFVLMALSTAASAQQQPDAESRARAHYEVGLGMYHLGNYHDAIREFSAGYELSPRPQFLINLGQAYRKLRDFDHARIMFRRYLATAGPDASDRRQVQQLLDEAERAAVTSPPPVSAPTASPGGPPSAGATSSPAAASPSASPSASSPTTASPSAASHSTVSPSGAASSSDGAAAELTGVSTPPAHRRSALRRFWWTIPVGAVVVGAAIGLGIYFGMPPSQVPCSSATIGCIDARP